VRLALGARRSEVLAMVVWSGVVLAGAGVALGLAAAVPATRLVSGMLFGVRPLDPMTLAGVAALLLVVSVAACLRPAWRASRLDPVRILRED
jgi:putative ABC transport system permease protein